MTRFARGLINDRWPLVLPDFRVDFHAARPKWETGRLADCADLLGPGMVVYDIGAEHGDFTALYHTWVGPSVVPIEPAPAYWPCLRGTYEANGMPPPPLWFRGFAASVDNHHLHDHGAHNWPRCSRGAVAADPGFLHLAHHADRVPSVTVDALADLLAPDALMIDVEGAEWHVLAGAARTLAARPLLVWVSVHEPTMDAWYHRTLADIADLMGGLGYEGTELSHHGEGETFWRFARS